MRMLQYKWSRRHLIAFALAVGPVFAATLSGQHPKTALDCGGRPPARYAVVLDASSSVRRDDAIREQTQELYARVLTTISGALCDGDRLSVYTLARDRRSQMTPIAMISAGQPTRTAIQEIARIRPTDYTPHTDFLVVLQRILGDLVGEAQVDAVFLVTDGSYYPAEAREEWTPAALGARLHDLAAFAAQVQDSIPIQVIGVRSDLEYAVDRELPVRWTDHPGDWDWTWRGGTLDMTTARGNDLLRLVFAEAYHPVSEFTMWEGVIEPPDGLWRKRFLYQTGWGLSLQDLSGLSIRHLVFLPPRLHGSVACPALPGAASPRSAQEVPLGTDGRVFCSLANPSPAEMRALDQAQVRQFAFLQHERVSLGAASEPMRGLHQYLAADSGATCDPLVLSRHFGEGSSWPPPGETVGRLEVVPLRNRNDKKTVDVLRYQGTHCLIAAFSRDFWWLEQGEYLLVFNDGRGGNAQSRTFSEPTAWVSKAVLRPGGFPFPPDKLGLLRVCVETDDTVLPGAGVKLDFEGRVLHLTADRGRDRCEHTAERGAGRHLYGFSGIVSLSSPEIRSARLFVAVDGTSLSDGREAPWVPVEFRRDGRLFLSWWCLLGNLLLGAALQIVAILISEPRRRGTPPWYRRSSALWSIVLSAVLVVVFVEAVVLFREINVEEKISPLFVASLLIYLAKVVAATLTPEYVEESMWSQ